MTSGPAPIAAFAVVAGLAVLVTLAPEEELWMSYLISGVVFSALAMSPFCWVRILLRISIFKVRGRETADISLKVAFMIVRKL